MKNMWANGVLGVVVGDALGCPVQFESRKEVSYHPVKDMRGYGTFNLPEGTWTDDSSLTLALLDSLNKKNGVDLIDIMDNFVDWLEGGKFTPFGYSFDIGGGTMNAIKAYEHGRNTEECGGRDEWNNGNGSLMRIMPVCLHCIENKYGLREVELIHSVGSLTHAHIRSNIACGLYYFMAKSIVENEGTLIERMQKGLDKGFAYYENTLTDITELDNYKRIRDLNKFSKVSVDDIRSSGYVVDTLEASVWSLINTESYVDALLTAVNLGLDTDTVGAVTGGLAGLFYGINDDDGIPSWWIDKIKRIDWIKDMCKVADNRLGIGQ